SLYCVSCSRSAGLPPPAHQHMVRLVHVGSVRGASRHRLLRHAAHRADRGLVVVLVVFAGIFVAAGLFALTAGLIAVRATLARQPAVDHPLAAGVLGEDEAAPVTAGDANVVYRAAEPLLALASDLGTRLSPKGRRDLIERRIIYAGREGSLRVEQIV